MATVDKHELLFSTDLKYFKALQLIGGKSIFDKYRIANTSIIGKYIDEKYRNFLAYPVKEDDKIEFHGIKSQIDDPQILAELQGDNATKYQNLKRETLQHYQSKIDELKKVGKTTEAEFLTDAIKSVDDRFVFCYEDKVVLGAWGMQLRENVREDINEIRKKVPGKRPKKQTEIPSIVPPVVPPENPEPIEEPVEPEAIITPQNEPPIVPPTKLPWYKRFWLWFTGKGCLKWLLWLLLLLLLLLLLCWLFRSCSRHHLGGGAALGDNDSIWLREDPARGHDGGIYDTYNPYKPTPTPPGYENVLPPQQGVLPPMEDEPEIIPGNPSIIANRLNILMENENKSIMDLAKDFKAKYSDDKYKVVYYDDVVKRMQIEIPKEEREQLKQTIPSQFAPEYELFVFDEAVFEGTYTPNDPAFSDQSKAGYLNTIKAQQAWDITRGSEKITVAIVDNGFNLKHPELNSKVVQPYNVWLHSQEIFPQQIDHGTHIAGTALATADNGKGLCGIAPNCKFMPIQVADKQGVMTTTSVLDGILYALYQGADVVNVSLGSQFTSLSQFSESVQQDLIRNHFKEEERLWREIMRIAANHNSTVVLAAGNDNVLAGIDAIQRPELFITVSATDKNNRSFNKAEFSNYGSYSTISAPGVGIYSSIGKNDYQTMDGTSMAAPIVTGTVALMKSINDTLTTKQIICILQTTGLETQGNIGNLIQLDKALQKVQSGDTVDCTPPPSTGDVQVLLSWNNYNDLDLICTDPQGAFVWFKNKRVPSGGQLQIDMNVEYPDSKTPIENIYWQQGGAPNGTYNVYLLYYRRHESAINETPYNIKVIYGGKTEGYSGTIKKEDKAVHIGSFTLGTTGSLLPTNVRRLQLEQERDRLQQELGRVNDELRKIENGR
jgi:subtilisin family serine protease